MNPTVSIIIPAYNAEATLDRCLESILTQSLRDIEVLCINDGSTDGTGEVLNRWEKRDARVRIWQFEENKGFMAAENLAIRESSGKYVMFVDSDDRLLPGACENLVRLIEKYDVDVLQFRIKVTVPPGRDESILKRMLASNNWTSEGISILYDCFSMHRFTLNICNKVFRGNVCRAAAASMPDLRLSAAADVLQSFFFLYYAKTFRSVTDGPYYEYFIGNGVWTHAPTAEQFTRLCRASAILPAIEEFLRKENALENNRFLLDAIGIVIKSGVQEKLLAMQEITPEIMDLAVKTWGNDVIYDFIKATGLLDVKCKSRYQLVTTLVNQIRKQQSSTSAGETAISVGGHNTAQPATDVRPAQKEVKR